jgi:tetratricopeptide (TPR) repeat protein
MAMKYAWGLAMAVVLAALVGPRAADSCASFEEVKFTSYHHALPGEFESGRLGVLRPHYYRRDLLLAYRVLSGVPVRAQDKAQSAPETVPARDPVAAWLKARKEIAAVPAPVSIDTDKKAPGSEYQVYTNCLGDAFEAAAITLQKRVAQWGAGSPNVAEWVRGQDQVFQNCSGGPAIPKEIGAGDRMLAADRRYQIAAAEFYAGQYEHAESGFDAIASDAVSPWHEMAPYLAARACIRQGTVSDNVGKLHRAIERLQAILDDPARKGWHARARGLLDFARARVEPADRLVELGRELMRPEAGEDLEQVLTDYTLIWDHMGEKQQPPSEKSDVADWISTFQGGATAIEKWRSKRTAPWLVAALAALAPGDAAAPELIAAAHRVPRNSPAWASVTYYGIRQQILAGSPDAARGWADEALGGNLPESARNLFRSERMRLARDWMEFLRDAPRKPVVLSSDGWEMPLRESDPLLKKRPAALDADAVFPFNRRTPLRRWMDAANHKLLPNGLQGDLALAGWVRAIVLDDRPAARALAARVSQLKPDFASEMRGYLAESDPATAQFQAVFIMLRFPGLAPVVQTEGGESVGNWWAQAAPTEDRDHEALFDLYAKGEPGPREFLPPEERTAGQEEWTRLIERAGSKVNFPCSEAIAWARSHPQDPRVPQALHLVVRPWNYGPASDRGDPTGYSKQAFDILHRRYPNSEWTKKTKYWY